ncbi:MFS transporter [Marinitenerispora sediminis]|uniref:MFS transporter n=1 Tax=Marinitenerispora sediminis TaxID=1931232 RepID=A0A368T4C3_9ACTN|nr:MFS transporter [Marinitenerispora sediminis]RCV57579.1 MFS transporter [Marinitenerispora sediminis]RCV58294.1 MFS transporter [Marinitenerispora sediminis]RCV59675.1 MFS transporter [Marinitenerispora sediminis]
MTVSQTLSAPPRSAAPYLAFAGLGTFWGIWGATLPLLRERAGVTDGEFGIALLFVGAGALPAMLATGRLIDALGLRVAGVLLAALGLSGVLVAGAAANFAALCAAIFLVGASSGATDVAINALAATVERRTGRPVVSRSHGAFSLTVAVVSLGAGGLGSVTGNLFVNFTAGAVITVVLARTVYAWAGARPAPSPAPHGAGRTGRGPLAVRTVPLLAVGVIGALAFASENAYQSWGAVLFTDEYLAPPALAALAPAAFAALAALTRFLAAGPAQARPVAAVVLGAVSATAGGVVVMVASSLWTALLGIAAAAVGTAVIFPTLVSYGLRSVADRSRGRATSAITSVAYLGFLVSPAYFGLLADASGVRQAFLGVAALTAVLVALVPVLPALRRRNLL